jgi:hypothetical protein
LRQARRFANPAREPRLALAVEENLALALHGAGRTAEALELMPRVREAAAVGTHLDWLRIIWLEGMIALEVGQFMEAERCLLEARDGFSAEGIGYDAALVCLDLATLYLRQGRTAETRRLATEMLPIFRSRDIHREALAALVLFRQALELEQVTASMIAELRSYLLPRRGKPALETERPS